MSSGCKENQTQESYSINPISISFNVLRGSKFDTVVYVKNKASKDLFISEIATACGCTGGLLKDSTIMPNDSVQLKVSFTPDTKDSGNVVRFISIRTNGTPAIKTNELRAKVI